MSTPRLHDRLDARGVGAEQALEQGSLLLEAGVDGGDDGRQAFPFPGGLGLTQELSLDPTAVITTVLTGLKETALFERLLRSYPSRIKAVVEAGGGHTEY